jgi:multicomponent Na+:H+ antiporter subunit D
VYLDFDWSYRVALPWAARFALRHGGAVWTFLVRKSLRGLDRVLNGLYRHHGPQGVLARTWPTGSTVLWVAILLAAYLALHRV